MFDKQVLLRLIGDKNEILDVYAKARTAVHTFPTSGCAATCSNFLRKAGMEIPVLVNAEALADRLEASGWERVSVIETPSPGDVFVSIDKNRNGMADHIGIVAEPDGDSFYCVDNHLNPINPQPNRRKIQTVNIAAVEYWLRWPS